MTLRSRLRPLLRNVPETAHASRAQAAILSVAAEYDERLREPYPDVRASEVAAPALLKRRRELAREAAEKLRNSATKHLAQAENEWKQARLAASRQVAAALAKASPFDVERARRVVDHVFRTDADGTVASRAARIRDFAAAVRAGDLVTNVAALLTSAVVDGASVGELRDIAEGNIIDGRVSLDAGADAFERSGLVRALREVGLADRTEKESPAARLRAQETAAELAVRQYAAVASALDGVARDGLLAHVTSSAKERIEDARNPTRVALEKAAAELGIIDEPAKTHVEEEHGEEHGEDSGDGSPALIPLSAAAKIAQGHATNLRAAATGNGGSAA